MNFLITLIAALLLAATATAQDTTTPGTWLDLSKSGSELYLPKGRYTADEITHAVNLTGEGMLASQLAGITFRYHGVEDFRPPFAELLKYPIQLRRVALSNCTIDLRFVSLCTFDECWFHACDIQGFSWWDSRFRDCRFVKTRITLLDGTGDGNRGLSNALLVTGCTFEHYDGPAVYLGAYSRVCRIVSNKFDRGEPAIQIHPMCMTRVSLPIGKRWAQGDTVVPWSEHVISDNTYRGAGEPSAVRTR